MLLEKTVGLFVRKNVWNLTISSESVEWTDWPDSRIEVVLTPAKPSGVLEIVLQVWAGLSFINKYENLI